MIIKVCGMRDAKNIQEVDEIEAVNWMGFIFFPRSSRDVGVEVPSYMPENTKRVGVFVNEYQGNIQLRLRDYNFDLVQLHGDETPEYCVELRKFIPENVQIIKMIQIAEHEDIKKASEYEDAVDYFLFETKCSCYGGSGKQFDWSILSQYKGKKPFILTGGIGPDDAEKVKAFQHPMFAGIDLNSKFESAPAMKDVEAIKKFIKQL